MVLLSALFLPVAAQQCTIKITGHVENAETHEKLAGASIRVVELDTLLMSDEKGDFVLENLCAGSYTFEISHISCLPYTEKIAINRSRHIDFHLQHDKEALEEVVISGVKSTAVSGYSEGISGRELNQYKGMSISEALAGINGVTLLQTGSTIAKPVIHGLHGSRVLTINNGVRQEAQQWGNEHAPEIDPFIAENMTVVKGVESLKYGSDAIAGVVLVEPAALKYNDKPVGEFITGYFTNNSQWVAAANYEQKFKNLPALSYRIQGSFKKAANINTPGYRLNNTGLQEQNISILTGWKKENYTLEAYYSRFQNSTGIFTGSHIGNLTDLLEAIEAAKPADVYLGEKGYAIGRPKQDALHHLLKLKGVYYNGENKFQLIVGFQDNLRKEYNVTRNQQSNLPQQELSLQTLSEDLSWDHPSIGNLKGTAGISMSQKLQRTYGRYFMPNFDAFSTGAYLIESWRSGGLNIQGGARFDHKKISTKRLRFNNTEINHDFNYTTIGGALNARYVFNNNLKVNVMTTLAGRAPDVNELLSDGIHHGTASYELGDINLKVEKAFNTGFGIEYNSFNELFSASLFAYNNQIKDFIYRKPVPDEPVLTVAGAFPKIVYGQTNARLQGIDASIGYRFSKAVKFDSKVSLLRAKDKVLNDWLVLMPSDRLSQQIMIDLKNSSRFVNNYIRLEFNSVLKQNRIPEKGNVKTDYKLPPEGYNLTNLHASTSFKIAHTPVELSAGVNNLFNISYREYLNSFRYFTDDMGRNFIVRIKIILDKNISEKH